MSSNNNKNANLALPVDFLLGEAISSEKENIAPADAWQFYSSSIKRFPNDLALHTHRVFFAMSYDNSSFLVGTLHDLFYVLKDAGEALRIRLLKAARPYLKDFEVAYLASWIKSDNKKQMEFRWVAGSVLSEGLIGADQNLIDTNDQPENSGTPYSALEEAQSFIEYGQLEMAQKTLQEALTNENTNDIEKLLREELDNLQLHLEKHKEEV